MSRPWLTYRRLSIAAALLILVLGSWWVRQKAEQPQLTDAAIIEGQPSYYMKGLRIRAMDQHGSLSHFLSAKSLVHYQQSGITTFIEPQIVIYREGLPAWVVEARMGRLDNQQQRLILEQQVAVTQGAHDQRAALQLKTEALEILLQEKVAHTDHYIELRQEGSARVEGIGMTLYLAQDRLTLHQQVKFVYGI